MTESLVQKAETAHELVTQLMRAQTMERKLDVMRGRLLWELKADNLYKKAFGEGVDTWEEFLRSPEIALTVSESNRLMQLYEYYVLKYELDEDDLSAVPVKSLNHLLPRLKSGDVKKEDLPELIEAGKNLTFNEFKERLHDIVYTDNATRTYTYLIMRKCNETRNLSKVIGIHSADILAAFPGIENA